MGREPTVPGDLLTGIHVLIVEDNDDARELFRTILVYAGALVTVATGAEQALDMCAQVLPDIVVTDIAMPDRDGLWLVQQLRAQQAVDGRRVPVVAVTGQGNAQLRWIESAGFADVLRKPVDPWELCRVVHTHARAR